MRWFTPLSASASHGGLLVCSLILNAFRSPSQTWSQPIFREPGRRDSETASFRVRLSPNARRCSLSQILASVHRYSHGLSLRKHCIQDGLVFRASSDGISSAMPIVSCVIGGPFIIASSSWLECAALSLRVKMQFNERCLTGIHF